MAKTWRWRSQFCSGPLGIVLNEFYDQVGFEKSHGDKKHNRRLNLFLRANKVQAEIKDGERERGENTAADRRLHAKFGAPGWPKTTGSCGIWNSVPLELAGESSNLATSSFLSDDSQKWLLQSTWGSLQTRWILYGYVLNVYLSCKRATWTTKVGSTHTESRQVGLLASRRGWLQPTCPVPSIKVSTQHE